MFVDGSKFLRHHDFGHDGCCSCSQCKRQQDLPNSVFVFTGVLKITRFTDIDKLSTWVAGRASTADSCPDMCGTNLRDLTWNRRYRLTLRPHPTGWTQGLRGRRWVWCGISPHSTWKRRRHPERMKPLRGFCTCVRLRTPWFFSAFLLVDVRLLLLFIVIFAFIND